MTALKDPELATAFTPVSAGFACEVKYQIMRVLTRQLAAAARPTEAQTFRAPEKDATRHIFDWQITPMSAVTAYLEADFRGVFEREDLVWDEKAGEVVHRALRTRHPHEFRTWPGERMDAAEIDAHYGAARSKFDYLAERFRRLLGAPGPHLYVCTDSRDDAQVGALLDLLSARSPAHEAHLLIVSFEPPASILPDHGGRVHRAWRPVETPKTAEDAWQGDDYYWDQILGAYDLTGRQISTEF